MTTTGAVARAALAIIFVTLHFTFRPVLLQWLVAPSFLLGGFLLASLRMRAGYAATLGFALGLLEASMALEGMGVLSIVFTVLGYLGARSRDLLFADAKPFIFVYLFAGSWVSLIALGLVGRAPTGFVALFFGTLGSAILTAAVCGTAERVFTEIWP